MKALLEKLDIKKKNLKKISPPITSNNLQTIVDINKNKISFKSLVFNEKNYISLNIAKTYGFI